jgi:hypothetical protein
MFLRILHQRLEGNGRDADTKSIVLKSSDQVLAVFGVNK